MPTSTSPFPAPHRSFYAYAPDRVFLEGEKQEYPTFGYVDLKLPAMEASVAGKTAVFSFKYKKHEICDGKPALKGLPSSKANGGACQTLTVTLADEAYGVEAELSYTVFDDSDVIARSARIVNAGKNALTLHKAFSCSLDIEGKSAAKTEMISLRGAWAKERNLQRKPLFQGISEIGSTTGESSHYLNPFIALCDKDTTNEKGDSLGVMLVYSGNHRFQVNVDAYDNIRVMCGIHDSGFEWTLPAGESFQTPECLLVLLCAEGFERHERQCYHDFLNGHILPRRFMDGAASRTRSTAGKARISTLTRQKILEYRRTREGGGRSNCSSSTTAGSVSATTTRLFAGGLVIPIWRNLPDGVGGTGGEGQCGSG